MDEIVHAVQPVLLPRGELFVVTCHDLAPLNAANSISTDYTSLESKLYRRYFGAAVSRSFKRAEVIIADSTQTSQEINGLFDCEEKVRVVNPGIGEKFKREGKSETELMKVGCTRDSIKRAYNLKKRLSNITLLPLAGYPEDAIVEYYNTLDYFVDFAAYRGFGYPILEARACGVTVFTLRNAKIPEEVKRFTIQVGDEDEAADMISKGASQQYEVIPYTLDRMASEILSIYQEVLGR